MPKAIAGRDNVVPHYQFRSSSQLHQEMEPQALVHHLPSDKKLREKQVYIFQN